MLLLPVNNTGVVLLDRDGHGFRSFACLGKLAETRLSAKLSLNYIILVF